MKITIHFITDDEEQNFITTFYNAPCVPFSIGDKVNLEVPDLFPYELEKFHSSHQKNFIENNKTNREKFNRTVFEIISEGKYIKAPSLEESTLTIEFFCKKIENEDKHTL